MKSLKIVLLSIAASGTILFFQNCGKTNFGDGTPVSESSEQSASVSDPSTTTAAASTTPSTPSSSSVASSGTSSSTVSVSASGNSITSSKGQTLSFTNDQGLSIGNASLVSQSGGSIVVGLYNVLSGRQSRVFVNVDPSSGKIVSVTAATPLSFMCHNPYADPCGPNYVNLGSGAQEANCNSPIYFNGAISGSVGNETESSWVVYNCH